MSRLPVHLGRETARFSWNRDHPPAVRVRPGAVVSLDLGDASGGQLTPQSTPQDVVALDLARVNPVTGPIAVEGAEPGDALRVEIVAIETADWGWTANIPGFGLLADVYREPALHLWRIEGERLEYAPGIAVPRLPFIGTIGVAPAEAGDHPLIPPRPTGGNLDTRQMTAGSRLWLPVAVPEALFSAGDGHAAQGDGEICGTAVETASRLTVRLDVEKGRALEGPILETAAVSQRTGPCLATLGVAPDLMAAARQACLAMIRELSRRTGLAEVDAYLLASVAADLKISEIVDAPNWVVSCHLPLAVLGSAA